MYKIILLKFENRKLKIENRIHNMISPIVGTTFAMIKTIYIFIPNIFLKP